MALFDFLLKPIQSALTPPGFNAARIDANRKAAPQALAGDILNRLKGTFLEGADLFKSTFPAQKQAYKDIFALASPAGVERKVSGVRRELLDTARNQARLLGRRTSDTGGIGLEQGLMIQGENAANQEANDLFTYFNTPAGQAELSNIILDLSKRFPGIDVFALLNEIIQNRPPPAVGPSPLHDIASAAPLFM